MVHPAQGGWDSLTSPSLLPPDWLTYVANVEYTQPGLRAKRRGTVKHNASAVSTFEFQAISDFWTNDGQQMFVACTDNGLYVDQTASGTWTQTAAGAGFSALNKRANFVIAQGYAVACNSLGTQKPRKTPIYTAGDWTDLSTCTPNLEAAVYHLRRLWGFTPNSSTVYFSAASDITDWIGEDASSILLDEDDMDKVVGISKPFRGAIYIFKGPNVGSIHAISGRTIRQFARDRIMDAAPCVGHASIITTPNDVYWLSTYGAHSLSATQKYGNTEEAYISHRIRPEFFNLQTDAMDRVVSFYHPSRNLLGWFVPEAGTTFNSIGLIYNYALDRWSQWFYPFAVRSCMVARDPTPGMAARGRQRLYLGGYDGYVRAADQGVLLDDGTTPYTAVIRFAAVTKMGDTMPETSEKSFQSITTFVVPNATDSSVELTVSCDGRSQVFTVSLLAPNAYVFGLTTPAFGEIPFGGMTGGLMSVETPYSERGRTIGLQYVQAGGEQDLNVFGYAVRAVPAEGIAMETS